MSKKSLIAAVAFTAAALTATVAQAEWNAYAINGNGIYGYAYGWNSPGAAEAVALDYCGDDCYVIMSVNSTCFAFADTHDGGYWYGYAYAPTKWHAKSLALSYCEDTGADHCVVRHSYCN